MNNRPTTANQHGYAVLEHRVMVRISGPGTDKFVQGQFSQHVDDVTPQQSRRAAASTPKGRAYCLTRLVRDQQDLLMDLDRELSVATLGQLKKYLMLFRGTRMDVIEQARIIGLLGQEAAVTVAGDNAATLGSPGDVVATENGYLIRIEDSAGALPRYEWWLPEGAAELPEGLPELTINDWNAASIAAGVPWLTPATVEAYVPQMLNLQHLQGVHFKKGCYTGQEVIARMHFLGQLKKSLYRLAFTGCTQAPEAGSNLLAGDKKAGDVVNAVMTSDNGGELLAVLRHDADKSALSLEGNDACQFEVLDLPYPVPEREADPAS